MKAAHKTRKPKFTELLRSKLATLLTPEGSLSLMLPPGLDQPGMAADDLLERLRRQ